MFKYIFYIQTLSKLMILRGLSFVKSDSLKATGFADISEMGFINEKWMENELRLPGFCSSAEKCFHTSLAIHFEGSIT